MVAQVIRRGARMDGWGPIIDMGFYKEGHLAAVASSAGQHSSAHLVLVPVPSMEPGREDTAVPSAIQVTFCTPLLSHDTCYHSACPASRGTALILYIQ
jgi:hypothetical protein